MISTLAVLKKKMVERPWLYEEEEHAVLRLAEDAVKFIQEEARGSPQYSGDTTSLLASEWLKDHE